MLPQGVVNVNTSIMSGQKMPHATPPRCLSIPLPCSVVAWKVYNFTKIVEFQNDMRKNDVVLSAAHHTLRTVLLNSIRQFQMMLELDFDFFWRRTELNVFNGWIAGQFDRNTCRKETRPAFSSNWLKQKGLFPRLFFGYLFLGFKPER